MRPIGVIGGGPAGSATALYLIRQGIDPRDIAIYDKARFPRPKLCGGGITFRGTERLRSFGLPSNGQAATQGLSLASPFGTIFLREPGPQLLYDRALLDDHLVGLCRTAGVEVREESPIRHVEAGAGHWRISIGQAVEKTRWLVGADGAAGITRRSLAMRGGWFGRAVEGIFESAGEAPDPGWLYFHFEPLAEGIPGYGWIFPYPSPSGVRQWKIGVIDMRGVVPGAHLRNWVVRFAAERGFRNVDPLSGWPEHYYSWRSEAHRPGLVLVGEAHGIDPLLGEGISCSFEMADFAAARIKSALDRGSRRIPFYEQQFALSDEGMNLSFQSFLADRLYGANGEFWLRTFFRSREGKGVPKSGNALYGRLLRKASSIFRGLLKARSGTGLRAQSRS